MRTIAGAIIVFAGAYVMQPDVGDQFRFLVGVIIILIGLTLSLYGLRGSEK